MNSPKSYKFTIFGETYALMSDEAEQHVMSVAQQVDSLMKDIAAKIPHASAEKIAVLVALQLASQLQHAQQAQATQQHRQEELSDYLSQVLLEYCHM